MGTRSRQRVWFAIEAKSFELTMDGVGRRQKYVIIETYGKGRNILFSFRNERALLMDGRS